MSVGAPPPKLALWAPREKVATSSAPLVDGYLPSRRTHLIGGAQNCGKTAFTCWMLGELESKGEFLGHRGTRPAWVRLFVLDRDSEDWRYWCKVAGIELPEGYWLREDTGLATSTIQAWAGKPLEALTHFKRQLEEMAPEPGGLLIVDGGNALLGDANVPYFRGYAAMLGFQRITVDEFGLTTLVLGHAGKPKAKGSKDAKARDIDKMNMTSGAMGSADTLCYLASAEEVGEEGDPAPYQRFSWTPHHAKPETHFLARTETGLFAPYIPKEESAFDESKAPRLRGPRKADVERVGLLLEIARDAEKGMSRKDLVEQLMGRFGVSQAVAYRTIGAAEEIGAVAEVEGLIEIVTKES